VSPTIADEAAIIYGIALSLRLGSTIELDVPPMIEAMLPDKVEIIPPRAPPVGGVKTPKVTKDVRDVMLNDPPPYDPKFCIMNPINPDPAWFDGYAAILLQNISSDAI